MGKSEIIQTDLVRWVKGNQWMFQNGYLEKNHAVLSDPPYFLGSIVKRFGGKNAAPAKFGKDGAFSRASKGFMGQTWDGFESMEHYQAWVTEWAEPMLDAVYPGALGLFCGGTRTYHRLAAGLEDAGWEIIDCIAYMYGSGFPKSHNIGGHGTALKPAYEPIVVCRAPRGKHTFEQLNKQFGTGLFDIDGSRIGAEVRTYKGAGSSPQKVNNHGIGDTGIGMLDGSGKDLEFEATGRWPANVLLSHSEQCTDSSCVGECTSRLVGLQSGEVKSGGNLSGEEPSHAGGKNAFGRWGRMGWESHNDTGTAARFFYTSKPATWERDAGLDGFELKDGSVGDRRPSGSMSQRIHKDTGRIDTIRRNIHPTVKPITLTEYLARLLLPPPSDKPRRILIPFSGSGSEMIGAQFAGWEEVTGIEREAQYATIASARLKWWAGFKTYEAARAFKEPPPPPPAPVDIYAGTLFEGMLI